MAPLDLADGFGAVIVPEEGEKAYRHVIGNDARPHYIHQANLTGERLIYPILDDMLARYRATFADNSPLINPTMSEAGTNLVNQQAWAASTRQVTATVAGRIVTVANPGPTRVMVPVTLPEGSAAVVDGLVAGAFGEPYGGARSAWVPVEARATVSFQLPEPAGYPTEAAWPARADN